ncbi:flagellar FlbD family protein [Atopococcus tabaci]|uniref:flagellar FlbD family protein n=1 Tax=Atopococcus tabaci TaxID=269774 RepID=UPI0004279B81|nr:flagellar FlbD family protein [Atopococcus tabaci]
MIQLHDISGKAFYLNADLIYRVDSQYDTIVTLVDQKKVVVKESPEDIAKKVIAYKQKIYTNFEVKP